MAIVWNDRLAGALCERGVPGMMRAVRSTTVSGIAGVSASKALSYALQLNGMPQPGEPHPDDDRCLLSRARATPKSDSAFQIDLIYERVPTVTYRESNTTVSIRTMNLPGTRKQIMSTYAGTGWPGTSMKRAASIVYRCPMRKLVIGKALFGSPLSQLVPEEIKNTVGAVNDRPWMGMERGYWLCDGLDTQAIEPSDDFEVCLCYYAVATFFSQVMHDWSFWQFLQLPNGHFVKVEEEDIEEANERGYNTEEYHPYPHSFPNRTSVQYNSIPDFYAPENKGFVVAYPYPALDFYTLFGVQ